MCYRPPDTTLAEFKGMLNALDKVLSNLPAPTPNIIVMGDFNFPRTSMTWTRSEDGHLVPLVAKHRVAENSDGKRDRLQAQELVDLATKHCLHQEVERPTHAVELLDLIFSNNPDIVTAVSEESWPDFTDHKIVSVQTSFKLNRDTSEREEQHLCDTVSLVSVTDEFRESKT